MKIHLSIFGVLCALLTTASAADRPNIVIFLADDLGWADVGFHADDIKTPNLDRLARSGVQLEQFYVQPTCSPTRIALMSGRYPFRCGGHISVLRPHHKHGLPLDEYLLPQVLKDAGYQTAITGKWHLGVARRAYWPTSRGFNLAYGHLGGGIDYLTHEGHGILDWYDQDTIPLREEGYSTDLIGTRASSIIAEHDFSKQPLFLYVPFNAPHSPYQAKEEDLDKYKHIKDERRKTYCAMVDCMDQNIGKIMHALEEKGATQNTLVFFASDNGGSNASINKPLRGGKGTLYEGGTRVPSFISWPATIKGGQTFEPPLHIVDLLPTFAGLAGAETSKCKPLDGIDFWPALAQGKPLPKRDLLHNVNDPSGRGCIRSGEWKLILSKEERKADGIPLPDSKLYAELFNIQKDPYEQENLAAAHPELVETLWNKLKSHGPEVASAKAYTAKQPEDWIAPPDWSKVPE